MKNKDTETHGSLCIGLKGSEDIYDFVRFETKIVKERMCEEFLDNMFNDEPSTKKKYKKDPDNELFFETHHTLTWVYECKATGNVLFLEFFHYDNEDHEFEKEEPNVDIIINCIMPEPFEYMMDKLNNNKNITVFIERVPYTTTDYCIYYPKYDYNEPKPKISSGCKHTECFEVDGELKPIGIYQVV